MTTKQIACKLGQNQKQLILILSKHPLDRKDAEKQFKELYYPVPFSGYDDYRGGLLFKKTLNSLLTRKLVKETALYECLNNELELSIFAKDLIANRRLKVNPELAVLRLLNRAILAHGLVEVNAKGVLQALVNEKLGIINERAVGRILSQHVKARHTNKGNRYVFGPNLLPIPEEYLKANVTETLERRRRVVEDNFEILWGAKWAVKNIWESVSDRSPP
jgi:hypothetical protein